MNLKLKINSRGEIATILTLISVGLMLAGIVVGNVAVKQTTRTQSKAVDCSPVSCKSERLKTWLNLSDSQISNALVYLSADGAQFYTSDTCADKMTDDEGKRICTLAQSAPPPSSTGKKQGESCGGGAGTCGPAGSCTNDSVGLIASLECEGNLQCCKNTSAPPVMTSCNIDLKGECRATNNCERGFTLGNEGENGCNLGEFCCAVNDSNYPKPITASSICPVDYCKTINPGCDSNEDKTSMRCEDLKICCLPKGNPNTCQNLSCADYLTAIEKPNNTSGGKLVSYDSAKKLWYQDTGCNERSGTFTENSAGMNSYCSLPDVCTSCVFGKCAYHPERDPRSGRAEPGILQCTDTGCINDTECEFGRKCATNGEDCTSKSCCTGTNISGNQVDLICNAQKKCEPKVNPDDIPACDDFTDKKECEEKCGTRGCEGVAFAGGYVPGKNATIVNGALVPNCWRCNTKNYCSFGDENCTVGAGKPTPILTPSPGAKGDTTGKSALCPLPGKDFTNDCANCILKSDPWIINPNDSNNIAQNLIKNNKWKDALTSQKCTPQDMARYWCDGGDGLGNTKNKDSIQQCRERYLNSDANLAERKEKYRDCADLCKVQPKSAAPASPNSSCNLNRGNLDFTEKCSDCILGKRNEWITSKKISNTVPAPGPIRLRDNIPDSCSNEQVIEYWCSGSDNHGGSAADCKRSIDQCNLQKDNGVEICAVKPTPGSSQPGNAAKCNTTLNDSIISSACSSCINTALNGEPEKITTCANISQKINFYCQKNNCAEAFKKCPETGKPEEIKCQPAQTILLKMSPQSYTNEEYDKIIAAIKAGQMNAIYASIYVANASRVPGLQRQYCDPFQGQCDFGV